jgi:hypothetical protein
MRIALQRVLCALEDIDVLHQADESQEYCVECMHTWPCSTTIAIYNVTGE